MLDIIIPAYNSHKYISNALYSITSQIFDGNINVYIVNDCSDSDYSEIINKFSNVLNIKELKMKKNVGPGAAR